MRTSVPAQARPVPAGASPRRPRMVAIGPCCRSDNERRLAWRWWIAENRLLEPQLGHRVFLMDDLSATYDLANLSRDAIFWRQMAYGSGAQAGRRQVFLSSHHEDLSNRLLDVMPPVEERRMLLYRFTGWKKGKGPDFEVYDVQSQPALDAPGTDPAPAGGRDDRRDFAEWLQVQLTETVDASA